MVVRASRKFMENAKHQLILTYVGILKDTPLKKGNQVDPSGLELTIYSVRWQKMYKKSKKIAFTAINKTDKNYINRSHFHLIAPRLQPNSSSTIHIYLNTSHIIKKGLSRGRVQS
jgi:hypothetical protein